MNTASPTIEIVHEESHFVLVNKPAGLFSQAAQSIPSLQRELERQLKQRDSHTGTPFIGLPHRLDRATSGIMLIARNARALKRFGQQFQSRKIGKYYLALVAGQLEPGVHRWRDYIRKVRDEPRAELSNSPDDGREAILDAVRVWEEGPCSLLLVRLHTGRMHQIRLQCAARGLPVVGDFVYGSQVNFSTERQATTDPREMRLALHALRIEFRHPQTASPTCGTASLPAIWNAFDSELGQEAQNLYERSHAQSETSWNDLQHIL